MGAVNQLLKKLPANISCKIITQPPGLDYITGSVEVDALLTLENKGFSLLYLHNLHAKIYIIDDNIAYIGSANFTSKGWNGKDYGNVEEIFRLKLAKVDVDYIYERYMLPSSSLKLNESLIKMIKEGIEIHKVYKDSLLEWETKMNISTLIGKVFYSKQLPETKDYPYNFKFTFSKFTGEHAKQEKADFIFKLGGTKSKSDGEIKVPFSTMKKILITSHLNKVNDWSFHVSFDEKGSPFLRSTNFKTKKKEVIPLDSGDFKGKLRKMKVSFK
jgi:hypothetical protein